jgi:hypothetical protein
LKGVRELEEEEEVCGFREVLNLGSMGRRDAAPSGGELGCEEMLYKGGRLSAKEMDEEGGAEF